ncbi:syj1 [Symbiodinium microadriaticum]|nr:syj1 [Symbiodinium microadriaticum]
MLEKGWRAVNRAYCAHFEDDARQSAIQLLLRSHKLAKAPSIPEVRRSPQGKLRLALASWNLHGRAPWESAETLRSLVRGACEVQGGTRESPDIFVFCFQEFSELSASNVVLLSSGDELQQARFGSAGAAALKAELGESFWELRSCGMVGLFVGVFVAERLAGSVKSVSAERVRSGLYGQAGNKGAVAVSFKIEETSICAISLHLESGQHGKKAQERLEQLREILQGVRHEKAKYDVMVLGGDFNFRAAFPEVGQIPKVLSEGWANPAGVASSERRVGEGSYQTSEEVMRLFREYDEVTAGRSRQELQEILKEFSLVEGPVRFPPTYRLLEGQSSYDLERQPAWCDRVLHSRVSVVRKSYCALGHLNHTDHRPVCVMLELLLLALPRPAESPTRTPPSTSPSPLPEPPAASPQAGAGPFGLGPVSPVTTSEASVTPATVTAPTLPQDLLDFEDPPHVPSSPKTPMQTPQTLQTGQLVLAKFQTGWYLANVLRYDGITADVAWLRPPGTVWGNKEEMQRYLCSTGADETLHGEKLHIATHVRLPELPKGTSALAHPPYPSTSPAATNSSSVSDVKIRDLKSTAAQKIFQDKLAAPLIEAIGEYFELPPKTVVVDDAFIVRYATDSQRGLSFHRDGSIVSSIVTLSDENDYVGGGTEFLDGSVYRPSQGGGILFGGQRLHGGVEIERGARYICTIFFKCGGLSCRDLAVKKDKEEEGDPGIWGALANIMGVGQ